MIHLEKKWNSSPWSAILRDFQNQEYLITIPKSRTRLVKKLKEEKEEERRQLQCVMCFTQTQKIALWQIFSSESSETLRTAILWKTCKRMFVFLNNHPALRPYLTRSWRILCLHTNPMFCVSNFNILITSGSGDHHWDQR